MIAFRCQRARVKSPFDAAARNRIFDFSRGVPRETLKIAAHAWNMAKRLKYPRITPELIESAANEISIPEQEEAAVA